MKFDINLDKIPVLEKKGGQFYASDKAKDAIVQLLQMKEEAVGKIEAALDRVKERVMSRWPAGAGRQLCQLKVC